jgi:hypothetical protein
MKHTLSLEVPTVTNEKILRIVDMGIYSDSLPVQCARLEITVPGFLSPAVIDTEKNYAVNITSFDLGLQKTPIEDEHYPLPDGIYVIRYSVSPNEKVFVEYNHLRMTRVLNTYYSALCQVGLGPCEPEIETKEIVRQFQLVRSFLDAAKAKVEYCHEPYKGMELFLYAQRSLDKLLRCN